MWKTLDPLRGQEHRQPAPWVPGVGQRREFRNRIGQMRFSTGYGANLQKAFGMEDNKKWLRYLKTHDYHKLLQHVLLVAITSIASDEVQDAIWSLAKLLRWICSKDIQVEEIPRTEVLAPKVGCKLEKALPPSFFDCQVHLLVHLMHEVAIAGPVHRRWMY